jgi:hypothetical protein
VAPAGGVLEDAKDRAIATSVLEGLADRDTFRLSTSCKRETLSSVRASCVLVLMAGPHTSHLMASYCGTWLRQWAI